MGEEQRIRSSFQQRIDKGLTVESIMTFQVEQGMFLRNVTMLGGALLISYFGAGPLSVDALLTAGKESHAETPQCPIGRLTSEVLRY